MIGSLRPLNHEERVVCNVGDALRLRQSRLAPDLRRVTAIAEVLQALCQALLLGLERRQPEGRSMWDESNRGFAEIRSASLQVAVRAAGQVARPGAANAPDEGAILGVEFLHALVGLDHLRPADADPGMLGDDDAAATGGDDAAAAEGSGPTADQSQDRDARAAHLEDGADDLGDRELAGIRLLKPDPAGVEQQQHGPWAIPFGAAPTSPVARGPQQTEELRAMDLAERAPQEAPLLRRHEDLLAVETAAAHDDAVVEGTRKIELGEVRAHDALLGPEELDKALRVEQP